ncbi:Triacylglycerol lipase 2 [Spatholobus suberectus]|nr:Triacylglycerol lipase 2 [Spatholobus suberectus]
MANTVVSLFSIVLLCITAAQGRKTLHLNNEWLTSYPVINDIDGICKTMVETQGYTCEEHKVTTEDGYILSLQRMPVGQSGEKADKPPVLLQHGIFSAYWDWSWDELASYDLPAFVQYVYNYTGQRMHYAGHSMDVYWLGLREFIPNGDVAAKFVEDICNNLNLNCSNLMTLFTDIDIILVLHALKL